MIDNLPKITTEDVLISLAGTGAVIITRSNRQRVDIVQKWCTSYSNRYVKTKAQSNTKKIALPAPQIFTLFDFLWKYSDIENQLADTKQLMRVDSLTESWLWRNTFHKDYAPDIVVENIGALVQEAQRFHETSEYWNIATDAPFWHSTADMYRRWRKAFIDKLDSIGACTDAMLLARLAKRNFVPRLLSSTKPLHTFCTPTQSSHEQPIIILVGLVFTHPMLDMLLNNWLQAKIDIRIWQPTFSHHQEYLISAGEDAQGLYWVAKQAQKKAKLGKKVFITMPDFTPQWYQVFRIFWQVFAPQQSVYTCLFDANRAFNLSGGLPLAKWPSIACALRLLSLENNSTMGEVIALAKHPCIDSGLDTTLIDHITQTAWGLPLAKGIELWAKQWPWLASVGKHITQLKGRAKATQWKQRFCSFLDHCCWQPYTNRFSVDYRLFERWEKTMDALACIENYQVFANICIGDNQQKADTMNMEKQDALYILQTKANNDLYQPQVQHASVHVLSLFEAVGLHADHNYIFGLDARTLWSLQSGIHTIPLQFQHQYAMPASSSKRKIQDARVLCDALTRTASMCTFCHPNERDGVALLANSYIDSKPVLLETNIQTMPSLVLSIQPVEKIAENARLPIDLRTNSTTVASCMQCGWKGWWALAKLSTVYVQPQEYPDNRYTGLVLHDVLSTLGEQAKHVGFRALLQKIEKKHVYALVMQACKKMQRHAPQLQGKALEYKARNFSNILYTWLIRCEIDTMPESIETTHALIIANIHFSIRIDRTDRLTNAKLCIFDYKTGKKSLQLFEQRNADPQLLLYAAALMQAGEKIAGLGYGLLDPAVPEWKIQGTTEAMTYVEKKTARTLVRKVSNCAETTSVNDNDIWNQQLTDAIMTMEDRIHTIAKGTISLDPIDEKTCQYCDLRASCRIAAKRKNV